VSDYISGKWTLEEDEICLNILFKGKTSSPELVISVGLKELRPVADALTRHVYKNFKIPFFTYLIERKVAAFQEIDWRDVKRQFPTQTTTRCQFHQHFTRAFFVQKCFFAAFLLLQFGFDFFWPKNIGKKAACKILMKLVTV